MTSSSHWHRVDWRLTFLIFLPIPFFFFYLLYNKSGLNNKVKHVWRQTFCYVFMRVCFTQILSGVILEVLGEAFAEVVTPEVAAAWTKLLANICCSISAVYKEVGWTKLSPPTEWRSQLGSLAPRDKQICRPNVFLREGWIDCTDLCRNAM